MLSACSAPLDWFKHTFDDLMKPGQMMLGNLSNRVAPTDRLQKRTWHASVIRLLTCLALVRITSCRLWTIHRRLFSDHVNGDEAFGDWYTSSFLQGREECDSQFPTDLPLWSRGDTTYISRVAFWAITPFLEIVFLFCMSVVGIVF